MFFRGSFPYGKNWLDAVLEKRKIFDQAANSAFQRKYVIGLSEHKKSGADNSCYIVGSQTCRLQILTIPRPDT